MKEDVKKLFSVARKRSRLIVGLMSGTSLDGLDVALCEIRGSGKRSQAKVLRFETLPYSPEFKAEIRQVFAQKNIDFQHLVLLNVVVAEQHAALVNQCLAKWQIRSEDIDLLASHGQTVYHAPRIFHGLVQYPNATLQIGDGDHLSRRTGIITLSDFRQKHLAAGGEGAPLALYADYFLFSKKGQDRILLNIGGIANFTFLPADQDPSKAFATDTGPGNTLIDAFANHYFGVPFDEDARLASNGRVDDRLLDILKSDPFFAKPVPKTAGPELFSSEWVKSAIAQLPKGNPNPYDVLATLTKLTADTISAAIMSSVDFEQKRGAITIYLSGGGAHNYLIIKHLKSNLPIARIASTEELGIQGDAKEAVLFAVLANEMVAGRVGYGQDLGGVPLIGMGKISFPR